MDIEPKALIAAQRARPFGTTFNRQAGAVQALYGAQLRLPKLSKEEIFARLEPLLQYYPQRIAELSRIGCAPPFYCGKSSFDCE